MRTSLVLAILSAVLGMLGYVFNFIEKSEKRILHFSLTIICLLLFMGVQITEYFVKQDDDAEAKSERDSISLQLVSIKKQIEPLAEFASKQFPTKTLEEVIQQFVGQRKKEDASVSVADFYRVLGNLDIHYRNSLDQKYQEFSQKYYGMGRFYTAMYEIAAAQRLERDNIVDSLIPRLQGLGVNTDTLRFAKKLPYNLGSILRGRARGDQDESRIVNAVMQWDSL